MNDILLPPIILVFVVVTLRTVFNIELCTPKDKKVGEIQLHIQEVVFFLRLIYMFPPAGAAPRGQFQGMSCQEHNLMEAL